MTQQDRLPLLGSPAAGTSNSSCYQHQQAQAAALPIPNRQPHQHTQTNPAIHQIGRPSPQHQPERYSSYGSTSTAHSIGNNDLLSSFDSLSLSSSYQGQDQGLWSRLATQGTGNTDALSVLSDTVLYPQPTAEPGQQQTGRQLTGQQQRPQLPRYPSVDSNRSGSGQWTAMSESFKHRSDSLSNSCSGRYPAVPFDAAATTLGSSDSTASASTGKGRRYSWDLLEKLQGQQQQQPQQGRQRQRWQPPEGLYPVISGAPCGVQEEQEQQKAPPEQQTPWGFDLQVELQSVSGLSAAANPYVLVLMHLGETDETYRTEPQWNTQQAQYGQADVFNLANVQGDCILRCEVWDKRLAVEDAMLGRATWSLAAQLLGGSGSSQGAGSAAAAIAAPAAASGSNGADDDTEQQTADQDGAWSFAAGVALELTHPTRTHEQTGQLQLKVRLRPSAQEGRPRMQGPVRFRQHLCRTAGALKGHWADEENMCFSTYKLFLCQIGHIFKGVRMPWNKDYDKAQLVFQNPVVLALVQAQHKAMYSSQVGETRGGVLHTAADFFKLFNNGIRDKQPRFFTYTLCADSFRCSETGAAFFDDMCSKHAMHSGGAEEVLYAGEFCILPSTKAAADFKLVLDNNSGTYSPHKSKLPLIQQLFAVNFPDMEVEVLDWTSAKLAYYQSLCPSRLSPAGAGAATQAVTFRAQNVPQFVAG